MREALRPGAGVRNAHHLQHGGNVKLFSSVVPEPLVAEVEHVVQPAGQPQQVLNQGVVVAQVGEVIPFEFAKGGLHLVNGVEIVVVEHVLRLEAVRLRWVAQHHHNVL